ncbi:hypothetical protein FOZ63_024871, partial [Perkinsus olseni]
RSLLAERFSVTRGVRCGGVLGSLGGKHPLRFASVVAGARLPPRFVVSIYSDMVNEIGVGTGGVIGGGPAPGELEADRFDDNNIGTQTRTAEPAPFIQPQD